MANENDFAPWATAVGANVLTPVAYSAAQVRQQGVVAGRASSADINTPIRQATTMATMLAQFIVDTIAQDVVDNGDLFTIETNFLLAIMSLASRINTPLRPYLLAANSATVVAPPAYPQIGDTYIIPPGATGVWLNMDNYVTQWTGAKWVFVNYPIHSMLPLMDTGDVFERTSTGWRSKFATLVEAAAGTRTDLLVNPADLVGVASSYAMKCTASTYPPSNPRIGDMWEDTDTDVFYKYLTDGNSNFWIEITL